MAADGAGVAEVVVEPTIFASDRERKVRIESDERLSTMRCVRRTTEGDAALTGRFTYDAGERKHYAEYSMADGSTRWLTMSGRRVEPPDGDAVIRRVPVRFTDGTRR